MAGIEYKNDTLCLDKLDIGVQYEMIEDPEGRNEITTDFEGKIISYRDADGVKHEEAGIESKNISTNSLNLTDEGMSEFQQALKEAGFQPGGHGDWSDYISNDGENPLHLPIPRIAYVNFSNETHDLVMPIDGGIAYIEYWDMAGNYFKKNIILNTQGNSSRVFIKKNAAIDMFDAEHDGDAFSVKFGDWVPQDSFHFKAFYQDYFKGVSFINYQICDEVFRHHGFMKDRPWKRILIGDYQGTGQKIDMIDDNTLQIDNGARCFPDGFPCVVYCNGEFYGLFVMALKKHRDNYHMTKKEAKHIHLDGTSPSFFTGLVEWGRFEIRNPKSLIGTRTDPDDPTKYLEYEEGDELLDSTMQYYDSSNKDHVRSNKVKKYIIDISKRLGEANQLATDAEKKSYLETYFDIDSLLDYMLVNNAVQDRDNGDQNWQWITYDGVKWFVCPYDKDRSYGLGDNYITDAITEGGWNMSMQEPFLTLKVLYDAELKSRWNEYVEAGIFTLDNIMSKFKEWTQRFGSDLYTKEQEKWPESPCNRDPGIDTEHWEWMCRAKLHIDWISFKAGEYGYDPTRDFRVFKALKDSQNIPTTNTEYWEEITFDESKEYSDNDVCGTGVNFGYGQWWQDVAYYVFRSKVDNNVGNNPISKYYNNNPRILGFHDNIWRVYNYVKQTLEVMNEYTNS